MSGRRSHPRFAVAEPWDGTMRVLRDVIVDRRATDELVAVSHAPAVLGEQMALDLLGGGESLRLRVQVIESRPLVLDGAVRHRLRLALLTADTVLAAPRNASAEAN
jgi:hypothetical protein